MVVLVFFSSKMAKFLPFIFDFSTLLSTSQQTSKQLFLMICMKHRNSCDEVEKTK